MGLVVAVWLLVVASGLLLELLEARHRARHGHTVPPELAGVVEAGTLGRIAGYAGDKARLRIVHGLVANAIVGLFVFGGGLAALDAVTHPRSREILVDPHLGSFLGEGLLFAGTLVVLASLLELPFGWWADFRLEARHGFNRSTPRLWIMDRVKATVVSLVLAALATAAALALVWWRPDVWWLWVWGFVVAFSVFLLYISPLVIEPLFYRFQPVTMPDLAERLRALAERAGLHVDRVLQVDASRRSGHSNAYFTGIGRVKRIVLFDTLLGALAPGEIEAVLAHEIGHWRLHHIRRRLIANAIVSLVGLWVVFQLVRWPGLPGLVGVDVASLPARAVIVGFLASLGSLPTSPLVSWLSRRDERAADRYASRLTGRPGDLAAALARLARDNLATLYPHPVYAWFFHSHPPVAERIRGLRAVERAGAAGGSVG